MTDITANVPAVPSSIGGVQAFAALAFMTKNNWQLVASIADMVRIIEKRMPNKAEQVI